MKFTDLSCLKEVLLKTNHNLSSNRENQYLSTSHDKQVQTEIKNKKVLGSLFAMFRR